MKIDYITISYLDENRFETKRFDANPDSTTLDNFFNFLIAKGLYTDIQCSKTYTLTKAVLDKLEGGK